MAGKFRELMVTAMKMERKKENKKIKTEKEKEKRKKINTIIKK